MCVAVRSCVEEAVVHNLAVGVCIQFNLIFDGVVEAIPIFCGVALGFQIDGEKNLHAGATLGISIDGFTFSQGSHIILQFKGSFAQTQEIHRFNSIGS